MNNIIKRVWNQNRLVNIEDLYGMAFQAEIGGHTFEISGIDDTGAAVALSGTVSGVFRRPDNADIALTGSASDGVVSVTLSEDCYAVPGRFGLTIFVTSNSQKVAVYACVGTVAVSSTGNVAGDTPANVEDLIDDINAAIADLNSAIGQIPASYANVMAAIAPTYSGSALYSVGSYAWYNGSLYRCITAITTAEAWTAAHWTAAVLGNDVSDLKSAISPFIISYSLSGLVRYSSGTLVTNENYRSTDYIPIDSKSRIIIFGIFAGSSAAAYTFYDANYIHIQGSGQNSISGNVTVDTIPQNAMFVRMSSRTSAGETPYAVVVNCLDALPRMNELMRAESVKSYGIQNTTFFKNVNYFDISNTRFFSDKYVSQNGQISDSSGPVGTIVFPVEANEDYIIYIPYSDRYIVGESVDGNFDISVLTVLQTTGSDNLISFHTGATAKWVMIYFSSTEYNYDANKGSIILNKNTYTGELPPLLKEEYIPKLSNALSGKEILIFGDSITDCCNFTIANDETRAVTWRNPSNSYVDADDNTINYSMWPKIIRENQSPREIRNYAKSGAGYTTEERTSGNERQNLQYQITVALNDRNNPNGVFEVDNFVPDIVIFALGTNDYPINDTYESAMGKTVYEADGQTIDVPGTIAALDDTKFCESARKAYLRIKSAFPMAQLYCVLPLPRASYEVDMPDLEKMAKRYGCIIINGSTESGITREFNVRQGLGMYLKDGLHPNEKGQNLMARMILTSLLSNYYSFGIGFNSN